MLLPVCNSFRVTVPRPKLSDPLVSDPSAWLPTPTLLLPVELEQPTEVVPMSVPAAPPAPTSKPAPRNGVIELEIGGVQMRVRGSVDEASLCSVLRALRQAR